ncbi:MAG TPA: FtsX-like permease family protein, partial [Vicinamibacterales bacterium]|nr:FtsX-like permease family protein [Vicinamibacterales bacterium]
DPLPMFPAVQRAVARVDRTLAPYAPEAMDAYRAGTMVRERVSAAFMLGFGAFGLGLAALGMYGVMAFIIHERTMELAIRMALGATAGDILTLVVKGSGALIAAGVAAGAAGAAVFNRMLAIWLPQEKASGALDLRIVAGAAALVAVAAAAACLAPATLAARVGPAGSLRSE